VDTIKQEGVVGMAENVATSAALGFGLKMIMPESGSVGTIASAVIGGYFMAKQAAPIYHAYETAWDAKTMGDIYNAGHQLGDVGGSLAVNLPLSIAGYKLGAYGGTRLMASESMDGFAEWKAGKYASLDRGLANLTNSIKGATGIGTPTPVETAGTLGIASNIKFDGDRASLLDSNRPAPLNAEAQGPTDLNQQMNVQILLKSQASDFKVDRMVNRIASGSRAPLTDAEMVDKGFGVDPQAFAQLQKFATDNGLTIADKNLVSGRVELSGTVGNMQNAFGVKLSDFKATDGSMFRGREGMISVPSELAPHLEGVYGLDTRPQMRTMYVRLPETPGGLAHPDSIAAAGPNAGPMRSGTFTPEQAFQAYGVPASLDGAGQNTAFISLGGTMPAGWEAAMKAKGIDPSTFRVINTTGSDLTPDPQGANGENALDAFIHKQGLPKANVSMVSGENSDAGFIKAIDRATFPQQGDLPNGGQNSSVSISWGQNEEGWTAQGYKGMGKAFKNAAMKGVTVTAASGDDGAVDRAPSGKFNTDYPSSDTTITGVGGTLLKAKPDGSYGGEVAWGPPASRNGAGGGGFSHQFPVPDYQKGMAFNGNPFPGRGVPDIALNAAPESGWQVYTDDGVVPIGGTSAAAPAAAVEAAKIGQALGKPVGFWNPTLYRLGASNPGVFNDVVTGTNDGFSATKGWDPATGWGSINFPNLLSALKNDRSTANQVRALFPAMVPRTTESPLLFTVPAFNAQQDNSNR
jgi:kumamolisin